MLENAGNSVELWEVAKEKIGPRGVISAGISAVWSTCVARRAPVNGAVGGKKRKR